MFVDPVEDLFDEQELGQHNEEGASLVDEYIDSVDVGNIVWMKSPKWTRFNNSQRSY